MFHNEIDFLMANGDLWEMNPAYKIIYQGSPFTLQLVLRGSPSFYIVLRRRIHLLGVSTPLYIYAFQ